METKYLEYKQKYLKYKTKYLKLKYNGGSNSLIRKINNLYNNTENIYGIYHKKYNTTYGELELTEISKIFKHLKLNSSDVFYDLGCGSGKINFYVAEKYNIKSIGIEIIEKRYKVAESIRKKIKNNKLFYIYNDIFNVDLSNGTIFYTYNLTWGNEVNNNIIKKIRNTAKKCKYIISSIILPSCKLYKSIDVKFSSHSSNIYIYTL